MSLSELSALCCSYPYFVFMAETARASRACESDQNCQAGDRYKKKGTEHGSQVVKYSLDYGLRGNQTIRFKLPPSKKQTSKLGGGGTHL